jgi:hypothetical protein
MKQRRPITPARESQPRSNRHMLLFIGCGDASLLGEALR